MMSELPRNEHELIRLVSRACDDQASSEELRWLDEQLACDPQVRRLFLEAMALEANLTELAGVALYADSHPAAPLVDFEQIYTGSIPVHRPSAPQAPPANSLATLLRRTTGAIDRTIRRDRHPVRFWTAVSVLTLVFLSTLAVWIYPRRDVEPRIAEPPKFQSQRPLLVAKVVGSVEAREAPGSAPCFVGAHLRLGQTVHLTRGLVKIGFNSGATAILEGPGELRLEGDNAGELVLGKLVTRVPPPAAGFTIHTTAGKIVDLGTEFGMAIDSLGNVRVQVFEGLVRVEPAAVDRFADTLARDLQAGQSLTLSARGAIHAEPPRETARFVRHLPAWAERTLVYQGDFDSLTPGKLAGQAGWQNAEHAGWQNAEHQVSDGLDRYLLGPGQGRTHNASLYTIPAEATAVVFEARMRMRGRYSHQIGPTDAEGNRLFTFGSHAHQVGFRVRDYDLRDVATGNLTDVNALSASRHHWYDVRLTVRFTTGEPRGRLEVRKLNQPRFSTVADQIALNLPSRFHSPAQWTGLVIWLGSSSDWLDHVKVGYVVGPHQPQTQPPPDEEAAASKPSVT